MSNLPDQNDGNSLYYYTLFTEANAELAVLQKKISRLEKEKALLDKEWRGGCAMQGGCRTAYLINQEDEPRRSEDVQDAGT